MSRQTCSHVIRAPSLQSWQQRVVWYLSRWVAKWHLCPHRLRRCVFCAFEAVWLSQRGSRESAPMSKLPTCFGLPASVVFRGIKVCPLSALYTLKICLKIASVMWQWLAGQWNGFQEAFRQRSHLMQPLFVGVVSFATVPWKQIALNCLIRSSLWGGYSVISYRWNVENELPLHLTTT